MRTKLSLKEAVDRQAVTRARSLASSVSPKRSVLLIPTDKGIDRPIDFVRLLVDSGVTLKRARTVLDRLAAGRLIVVEINEEATLPNLGQLGVRVVNFANRPVDAKSIREKQGLSQPEFADLYGIDVDTLKNWEQGRNAPDGPARILLRVIERSPDAVIEARVASSISNVEQFQLRASQVEVFYPFSKAFDSPYRVSIESWRQPQRPQK